MRSYQSSLIYFNGATHKDMVTWNGIKYRYHKAAYLWNGDEFELVWKKLATAKTEKIKNLQFRYGDAWPFYFKGYFVGYDIDSPTTVIKRKAPRYERETLYIEPHDHGNTGRYIGASKTGKMLWMVLSGGSGSRASQMSVIDIPSGRVMTHVEQWYYPPEGGVVRCINIDGGYDVRGTEMTENDNYPVIDNGAGLRYMNDANAYGQPSKICVSTCWYSRNPHEPNAGEIYLTTIPDNSVLIAPCSFNQFYCVNAGVGKVYKCETLGALDNYTASVIKAIDIPADPATLRTYGSYTNGKYFIYYDDKIVLFNIVTEKFETIDNIGRPSQGWGECIQTIGYTTHKKQIGKQWENIIMDDAFSHYYLLVKGDNVLFTGYKETMQSDTIFQGYRFKEK